MPPKSLGNFGGDVDNFEWPRHTADFTLLRAYDSSGAPYRPTSRLQVSPAGAEEGNAVLLLGFPGRTMRYAPSCRLAYSDTVAVPAMVAEFGAKLQMIARNEQQSPEARLKLAGAKKSLANEFKRSSGKRVMMRKLGLVEERAAEERELCAKAGAPAEEALASLAEIYATFSRTAAISDALEAMRGVYHGSALLAAGHAMYELAVEGQKPEEEREAMYVEKRR